jgi:SAM-dependent methyltransferase
MNRSGASIVVRPVDYLSRPAPVSMADKWFEIASLNHFWIQRRFNVLKRLAGAHITAARDIAEIGCGSGLLQRQIEDAYGKEVCGFDLNETALRQNVSRRSKVCCYDILERTHSLHARFDLVLAFDVLEHILDEGEFLSAVLFHLAPSGRLVVNVPAGEWAFSSYDRAAGHVRRYAISSLKKVLLVHRLTVVHWTYWGLPLVPSLVARKLWLLTKRNENDIIRSGFDSRSSLINWLMAELSKLEWLPQTLIGTSLMAVCQKET